MCAMAKTIEVALLQSARTVAKHLRAHPDEPRALFMASMFAALCEGLPRAPDLPRDDVVLDDPRDRASARGVLFGMWREMAAHHALTPARAAILAERIAALDAEAVVCFVLAHEARSLGCTHAAHALMRAHGSFVAHAATSKIDRALLDALGLDLSRARVRWHADGHLAELAKEKRSLMLAVTPGTGRYVEEGKRGGSGFAVREHYERGAAHGTFSSPWHDGDEYAHEQPWLAWVSACAATVLSGESAPM
jgi:hypothetical protein